MSASPEARFRTRAGSTVRIFGPHGWSYEVEWDWAAEDACFGSTPAPDLSDPAGPFLRWHCDCCDGGDIALIRCDDAAAPPGTHGTEEAA
jgi:hypothetical protein